MGMVYTSFKKFTILLKYPLLQYPQTTLKNNAKTIECRGCKLLKCKVG